MGKINFLIFLHFSEHLTPKSLYGVCAWRLRVHTVRYWVTLSSNEFSCFACVFNKYPQTNGSQISYTFLSILRVTLYLLEWHALLCEKKIVILVLNKARCGIYRKVLLQGVGVEYRCHFPFYFALMFFFLFYRLIDQICS